jgi:hypothetical protein
MLLFCSFVQNATPGGVSKRNPYLLRNVVSEKMNHALSTFLTIETDPGRVHPPNP